MIHTNEFRLATAIPKRFTGTECYWSLRNNTYMLHNGNWTHGNVNISTACTVSEIKRFRNRVQLYVKFWLCLLILWFWSGLCREGHCACYFVGPCHCPSETIKRLIIAIQLSYIWIRVIDPSQFCYSVIRQRDGS